MDKKSTLGKFLALSQKLIEITKKDYQMIGIFTLLALSVGNVAFAAPCPGNTVRVTFEDVNGDEVTECLAPAAAKQVADCPCGKKPDVTKVTRPNGIKVKKLVCIDDTGATAPSVSISVGSTGYGRYGTRGYQSPRVNYGRGGAYYRSVPQQRVPCTEQRVSTRTTGQNPAYQDAIDATYAWRMMDGYVQDARVQADANTGAADRAMSAEAALAQEQTANKELEAEYRDYMQAHPPTTDSDDSTPADDAAKEVK